MKYNCSNTLQSIIQVLFALDNTQKLESNFSSNYRGISVVTGTAAVNSVSVAPAAAATARSSEDVGVFGFQNYP